MGYVDKYNIYTVTEADLYEPYLASIKTRIWCFPIALLFIFEDVVQLYLTRINYYYRPGIY